MWQVGLQGIYRRKGRKNLVIAATEEDLASPEARNTEAGPGWHARKTDTDRRTRSLLSQLRPLHPDSDITPAA